MSPAFNNVWLENSAVTAPLPSHIDHAGDVLLDQTVQAARRALQGNPQVDVVAFTSQTGFEFYDDLSTSLRDRLHEAGIPFDQNWTALSYSNSQPMLGNVFKEVDRQGLRALILALEPLGFYPPEERTTQIIHDVLDRPERAHIPSMMHGLSSLIESFCDHFGITPSAFLELKQQLTLELHAHKSNNPLAQRTPPLTREIYENSTPFTPLLNRWDCCPTTSQGAALVISPKERLIDSTSAVRVLANTTHEDSRSLEERLSLKDYPHNEALFSATNELFNDPLLRQSGLTRERFLETGILELHNATSPLVILLLIEMGFLTPQKAVGLFNEIDLTRINPSGGLLAGHPLAATAPVLLHQCRLQLLNKAPETLQLPTVERAIIQSIGGLRDRLSLTMLSRA